MHRTLLRYAICGLLASYAIAQPLKAVEGSSTPKMIFKKEGKLHFDKSRHKFGDVKRGDQLRYKFHFENKGKGPFTINGVHAACGCTVPLFNAKKIYGPNETGFVEILLDTTNFKGKISKTVTVMSNARHMATRNLTVSAFIKEEISAFPPIVSYGDVKNNESKEQKVKINIVDKNVKVTGIRYNEDLLNARLVNESGTWYVYLNLKPGIKTGYIKEAIYIRNTSNSLTELPLLVRANLLGDLSLSPEYIEFGAIKQKKSSTRYLEMKRSTDISIVDRKFELNINGKKVDNPENFISIADKKNPKKLAILLTNPSEQSGSVHGRVIFETTDETQKELSVDFYAFFK